MNQLTPVPAPATPPSVLAQVEIDAARSFAEAEKAASTRRCFARDWDIFRAWCAARLVGPLPAEPTTIADFLASEATAGRKASTITHPTAAIQIRYGHKLAGLEPATGSELLRVTMRGTWRTIDTAPEAQGSHYRWRADRAAQALPKREPDRHP